MGFVARVGVSTPPIVSESIGGTAIIWIGAGVYMVITRYPLPPNKANLPLPFFGVDHPIVLLYNIYQ